MIVILSILLGLCSCMFVANCVLIRDLRERMRLDGQMIGKLVEIDRQICENDHKLYSINQDFQKHVVELMDTDHKNTGEILGKLISIADVQKESIDELKNRLEFLIDVTENFKLVEDDRWELIYPYFEKKEASSDV